MSILFRPGRGVKPFPTRHCLRNLFISRGLARHPYPPQSGESAHSFKSMRSRVEMLFDQNQVVAVCCRNLLPRRELLHSSPYRYSAQNVQMNRREQRGQRCRSWTSVRLGVVLALGVALAGCTRAHYRRQADRETYNAVECATSNPRYALTDYTIEPQPTSRMYDPFNPDCEPMPPDDPESHELMHCVSGMRGWKHWHRYGDTPYAENPDWRRHLPLDENGVLTLDRRGAVEMSLLQSREFQQALEELYLAALSVTFERFRFDTQFFGTNALSFLADGPARSANGSQSVLRNDNTLRAQKLFATGSELVVGLANSLVWQFAGPDQYTANTLLNFSLVQPLLRAAGRAVVLELLTDAERAMLANIRQMEQFRRGFYLQVVAGRSPGPGPSSQRVGTPSMTSPPSAAGGLIGLLRQQITIRNQRTLVQGLRRSVPEQELRFEAGWLKDKFELELIRQALYDAESQLVQLESDYNDRLDLYKITLGLPPNLDVRIADRLLAQFDLISPELLELEETIRALRLDLHPTRPLSPDSLARLAALGKAVRAQLKALPEDFDRLEQALPHRRGDLLLLSRREEVREGTVEAAPYSVSELERRVFGDKPGLKPGLKPEARLGLRDEFARYVATNLGPNLAEIERLEKQAREQPPGPQPPAIEERFRQDIVSTLEFLLADVSRLQLFQIQARLDAIAWVPIDLAPEEALGIARENRPDWMNARADLVDSWRQIEVTANALQSDLSLTFSGDINTTGNNPVRFRSSTGRLQVGAEFDAPLTRVAERNAYRAAQIAYQRARRNYYAFEDRVDQVLRSSLRDVRATQLDFELRRVAVWLAAQQVDLTRLSVAAPPRPGQKEGPGGINTGRNLVQALQGLANAQNNLMSAWVDTEVQRMNLDFDLGTMQLDDNGMWIDPGPIEKGYGVRRGESPESGSEEPAAQAKEPGRQVSPETVPAPGPPAPEGT